MITNLELQTKRTEISIKISNLGKSVCSILSIYYLEMRTIHPVMAIVLITIITIAAAIVMWKILSPTTRQTAETGSEQVKTTQTQHIEEVDIKTLMAICANQPGGKYISQGLNKEIILNINGKKVIINPNGYEFRNVVFCIYRVGVNPDAPIVLAEANFSELAKLAAEGKPINWKTVLVCPVNKNLIKIEFVNGRWECK